MSLNEIKDGDRIVFHIAGRTLTAKGSDLEDAMKQADKWSGLDSNSWRFQIVGGPDTEGNRYFHYERVEPEKTLDEIREQVARLFVAAGCSCCQDIEAWNAATESLGKLLKVKPYPNGFGFDFHATKAEYDERPKS